MKRVIILLILAGALSCSKKETVYNKEAEFYVRGNCDMCKARIEKAAQSLEGVSSVDWNEESQNIRVKFDSTKIAELNIKKAIAGAGHGTKEVEMDEKAHEELPECCKVGSKH